MTRWQWGTRLYGTGTKDKTIRSHPQIITAVRPVPSKLYCLLTTAGRSGLGVACLTAVREVLGSNRTVGSCVYRKTTVIYSLEHGLCAPFLQCLGQLSRLPFVER